VLLISARKWDLSERNYRSLAKAVTWRFVGSLDTFLLSWFITGHPVIAATITAVEFFTKVALFWIHERIWLKIKWGTDGPVAN
jgi:uncharacterized membrane protein